ncbi:hypothetical protein [Azospirillum thermophilum]|uniref:hypothetical protein n=1 Tax=Azospirillum thermophilum TaxID=2202148 RepID=UPI0011B619C0|nr:hypothetical protein [Azospirillum thermophilum]
MRLVVACCAGAVALALSGCSSVGGPPSDDGVSLATGSRNGNFTAEPAGEMRDASGERCVVFDWDRPLTGDLAVRLRSASCESRQHPGWMAGTELSRTVIPRSQSNLRDGADDARR